MTQLTLERGEGAGAWGEARLTAEDAAALGSVVEVTDTAGAVLPSQLDPLPDGGAELVVHLDGAADGPLALAPGDGAMAARVELDRLEDHQGQEALRIRAGGATWVYHLHGAGFASLIDRDGADWLSFRPWGGSDGIYRGIPNLAHPENVFHPGAETCRTAAPRAGPLRVTLEAESTDGAWACRWRVYPDHAELTVLRVGHPYWFLYEGTPGGTLDEARGFSLRSDGLRRPLSERWDEVLPEPKWIAFGRRGWAAPSGCAATRPRTAGAATATGRWRAT